MENEDLLGGDTVEEIIETPEVVAPVAEVADVSPELDTTGAKSVAEAIDFGLGEVESRREGKKPAVEETAEEKTVREAAEAEAAELTANEGKTPEEIAAAKVEAEKAKDPAAKIKSAVDDPIPATVAEKTRDRMQTLIGVVKDQTAQIASHQKFVDDIAATGANPQEFGTMMSYMSAVHSDDRAQLVLARDLLLSELQGISLKLGEAAPGVDFLKDYPDLLQQVERGEVRRELAQETALNRTRAKNVERERTDTAARNNSAAAATKERDDAQAELTTLGNELFAKHGAEYKRRYAILEPSLEALGMLPPAKWKEAFLRAYNKVPALPKAAPTLPNGGIRPATPAVPAVVKGQPLRANKTPSGDSGGAPKSLFEAIDGALKSM